MVYFKGCGNYREIGIEQYYMLFYLFIVYFLRIGRHESRDWTMKDNLREYKLYNLQNQLQCGKLVTKDLRDF